MPKIFLKNKNKKKNNLALSRLYLKFKGENSPENGKTTSQEVRLGIILQLCK